MLGSILAFVPVLELDENRAGIRLDGAGDDAVAGDGRGILYRVDFADDLLDLRQGLVGALEGGSVGHDQASQEITLVLLGDEAAGYQAKQQHHAGDNHAEQQTGANEFPGKEAGQHHELVRCHGKPAVEYVEELLEEALLFTRRLQQRGCERRAQGQGVDRGNRHRDGNGDGELLVELAGNAAHGGHRHEHGDQRQRGRNDRTGYLAHGLDGGLPRGHALLHLLRHGLYHDNGIVHDDTDGQYQTQQGQGVYRETQQGKYRKGTDQRHRDCQGRNQGRACILQENVDDQDNECDGLEQRDDDFTDTGRDRLGGIEGDNVFKIVREAL